VGSAPGFPCGHRVPPRASSSWHGYSCGSSTGEDSCVHRQHPCTGMYPCPSRATDVSIGPYPLSRVKRNRHALACVNAHWCFSMPSGWRRTSSTWRLNSGSSSRERTPWCGSDTSPGIGTCPPDQPDIRDGMMGGAKGAGRHQRGAVAGEAGDAMDARGLQRVGQTHGRHDGGQPPRQPRRPHPRWPREEGIQTLPALREELRKTR
jgi:hypothetical protein